MVHKSGYKLKIAIRDVRRAADLIERHGWVQGRYGSCPTGFCITGALLHRYRRPTDMRPREFGRALEVIADYLRANKLTDVPASGDNHKIVVRYNDRTANNAMEAVRTMRAAADAAEKRLKYELVDSGVVDDE